MKIIITESQYNRILKEEEEQKVLHIPSLRVFGNDWNQLQKFLERKGNPPYSIGGDLFLARIPIESLGNLISVGGYLDLHKTPIKSLGNLTSVDGGLTLVGSSIKSLGKLTSVGGDLDLRETQIESLGNLQSVGGDLDLVETPLSKMYTKEQIREMVNVGGNIYIIISDLL
jgi:hypothetical protein